MEKHLHVCDPFEVVAGIRDQELYLYRNDQTPILKLGLQRMSSSRIRRVRFNLDFRTARVRVNVLELYLNSEDDEESKIL